MGHDVIAIGNHKLNTTSLRSTAVDLSRIFNATVRYGYVDDWYDVQTHKSGSYEFVEEGRVEKNENVFTLIDTLRMDRVNTGKYKNDIDYDFYGTDAIRVDINIFKDCFHSWVNFDSRWWSFVRFFKGEFGIEEEYLGYINKYRLAIWAEVKLLGGDVALYGDDQGDSYYILDLAPGQSFTTLLQKLKDDFGNACLDVSSFMHKYYDGKFEQIEYKAFVDDFKDL